MAKPGRPKLPKREAKGRIVPVRFSADEYRQISARAKASHMTVSAWIRLNLSRAVLRSIRVV
jgi:mobilization protein NikA